MNYNVREGIVLTSICGQHLLVACAEARKYCTYTLEVNETAAFIWNMIVIGMSKEEMAHQLAEEYEIPEGVNVSETIDGFINFLSMKGYILAGDNDNE